MHLRKKIIQQMSHKREYLTQSSAHWGRNRYIS